MPRLELGQAWVGTQCIRVVNAGSHILLESGVPGPRESPPPVHAFCLQWHCYSSRSLQFHFCLLIVVGSVSFSQGMKLTLGMTLTFAYTCISFNII